MYFMHVCMYVCMYFMHVCITNKLLISEYFLYKYVCMYVCMYVQTTDFRVLPVPCTSMYVCMYVQTTDFRVLPVQDLRPDSRPQILGGGNHAGH